MSGTNAFKCLELRESQCMEKGDPQHLWAGVVDFILWCHLLRIIEKRSIGMEKSEKIVDIETKFSITVDVLHK